MLGDFNAKVGKTNSSNSYNGIVGSHGLRIGNESGNQLLQFCIEQQFVLASTLFQQYNRRLYMLKSCDGYTRTLHSNPEKMKSSIIRAKMYPKADAASDHELLVAEV